GFLVPRTLFSQIMDEVKELLSEIAPKRIIVNGDFKHEFGRVSRQEWRDTFRLTELLARNSTELIFIKGNHDKILNPIGEKYSIDIMDHVLLGDIYVCHGDTLQDNDDFKNASTIIIGHEHPCVTVRDDHKFEKFKAFLVGEYEDKRLIVTPSFNPVEGSDITKEKLMSPFLAGNHRLRDSRVYIAAGDIYEFGTLKNFMR
ncbi:MAG: metallophosphoesterase, partial [Candidatus Woesearchaeota archaeon]